MFCYQCEQTAKGEACTIQGVCGKNPEVAGLQDLLIYTLQGLSQVAVAARQLGINNREVNLFTVKAAFSTLTNVDFDPQRFVSLIQQGVQLRDYLKAGVRATGGGGDFPEGPATLAPGADKEALLRQAEAVGLKSYPAADPDVLSLKHTLLFGLKGVCAYADHAQILGQEDDKVFAFVHEGLAATAAEDLAVADLIPLVLKCGEINLRAMELLDAGNTGRYGDPTPTRVPGTQEGQGHPGLGPRPPGPGGDPETERRQGHLRLHPRRDASLPRLSQTQRVSPLYGHYGSAWQNQAREFARFPGAILITTNCIQRPGKVDAGNLFTCGLVGWPGIKHISDRNFKAVIDKALALPGFPEDGDGGTVLSGFARTAVLGVAGEADRSSQKTANPPLLPGCRVRRREPPGITILNLWRNSPPIE